MQDDAAHGDDLDTERRYALPRLRLRAFFDSLHLCRPSPSRSSTRSGSRSAHQHHLLGAHGLDRIDRRRARWAGVKLATITTSASSAQAIAIVVGSNVKTP